MLFRPLQSRDPTGTAPIGRNSTLPVLCGLAFACVAVLLLSLWMALVRPVDITPTVEDCRAIAEPGARLSCYDRAALSEEHAPAKGAIAPRLRSAD